MRDLIKILVIGGVLFTAICIAQDWRNFFRVAPEDTAAVDESLETEVSGTVRQFVSLVRHAYQSGGDPRFAERLPAAQPVIAELLAEIEYLKRNGRIQIGRLDRFEVLDVERTAAHRAEVMTAEEWVVYTADPQTGARFDPDRRHEVFAEYRLARRGPTWQIEQWNLVPPPAPDEEPGDEGP